MPTAFLFKGSAAVGTLPVQSGLIMRVVLVCAIANNLSQVIRMQAHMHSFSSSVC